MKGNAIVRISKILGWTLLTIVLVVGVLLVSAVWFVNSEYLTETVVRIADENIDGHVDVGRIKLGFRPSFPILGVEADDIVVVSHAFDALTAEERGILPEYADTLLVIDHMSGALDIRKLLLDKELELHDVVLFRLGVNLVIARNGKPNYDIIRTPADTTDTSERKIKGLRIDRFSLEQPREMRFYNAADSTSASVLMLTEASVNGEDMPSYRLRVNGSLSSGKNAIVANLDSIGFGADGRVYWDASRPGLVAVERMDFIGAFLKARVTGEIDLENSPIIRKASVDLSPVAVTDLLSLVPEQVRDRYRLHEPYLSTDMTVGAHIELTAPMNLATDTLPSALVSLSIPPASLSYGGARYDEVAVDATVRTLANRPDSTVVDISRCVVAGRGGRLEASAVLSDIFNDSSFDADIRGDFDLSCLPPVIAGNIHGCLKGMVSADLRAAGRASFLKQGSLHRLVADGNVTLSDLYFLSADTSNMVQVGKAGIDFDTKRVAGHAPVLDARLDVDTATVLTGGIDLAFGEVKLGLGPDYKGHGAGDAMPVSGDLRVGRFNITSITDSAGAHISGISGRVKLLPDRYGPLPRIAADLLTAKVSAGSLTDRILIDNAHIKATLCKHTQGKHTQGKDAKKAAVKKPAPHRACAYIPAAEVYRYVYEKRHHGRHIRRVYGEVGAKDEEVLVWNLTRQFRNFLNEWQLRGSLSSDRARLLTPLFPLHNSISALDLKFSNDTVNISDISLLLGKSDITMSGLVTNVRRALTADTDNILKANLSLLSNSIDINEISAAVFTGAAYLSDKRHGRASGMGAAGDRELEARIDTLSKKGAGRSAPVLIPVNLDARLKVEAKQLLYGDIDMHDMESELLVYDGGVNLHDMKATSDAGRLSVCALYSAPDTSDMRFGFGMELTDFDIARFVKLVPAIDSITPLMHDFSGMIGADLAATCRIDSGMNIALPTLDAAIRIKGDNLAFIDPEKYRKLGKWLGFKNKSDNRIRSLNVEMTVQDGMMRVYPFTLDIDRYRLGVYGSNDIAMNFNYHFSVLKSPLPFRFGITVKGSPHKYKVRFGRSRFNENTVIESVNIVNNARVNLVDQIQSVFKRGVRNSSFARLKVAYPEGYDAGGDTQLSPSDSLQLIREGIIEPAH